MIQYYARVIGMPVIEQHGSTKIAIVRDVVVDHERGCVLALKAERGLFISTVDVQSWQGQILVSDDSSLVKMDELARVRDIFNSGITFVNSKVWTQSDEYVGFLYDFSFDTASGYVTHLHIAKVFWWWRYDFRTLPVSEVVEVNKKGIIIKDMIKTALVKKGLNWETAV